MANRRFLVELSKKSFNADVICLGEQLSSILEVLKKLIGNCTWYMGDIDTNLVGNYSLGFGGYKMKRVGLSDDLIAITNEVDQFMSGVFFAFKEDQGKELEGEYSTEDPPFRDFGDAMIEIRAFDTTRFEIYGRDVKVMENISEYFRDTSIKEN